MKKTLFIILFCIISITNINSLKADCNDAYNDALNTDYIIANINDGEILTTRARIFGLTKNIYAVVTNDYNDVVKTYHYSDTEEGMFTFDTEDIYTNINYIIRFYNEDSNCTKDSLKTITFKTDKYNPYSISDLCNSEYEIDLCNPFYDIKDMTFEEFTEKLTKKYNKFEEEANRDFKYYFKKYYLYVLIPFIIILVIFIVRIILLKRGNKHE